jgi:Ca2+-transporting ATPase
MHPLPNTYLHAAVAGGIAIQLAAANLPATARMLGNSRIPIHLWLVVFGAALLAWALAEALSKFAWRHQTLAEHR